MTQLADSSDNRYASALSTRANTSEAVAEVCDRILQAELKHPDLALLFVSHHHADEWHQLPQEVWQRLQAKQLIGCSGEAIVEGPREVEERPAMALWTACLPRTRIRPIDLRFQRTSEGGAIVGWPDDLTGEWPAGAVLLLLAEPFSFPADYLVQRVNEDQPGVMVLGGMASGAAAPRQNRLFLGKETLEVGAVAVLLDGGVTVTSVVSQGCRPIGEPLVVTKAERNIIEQLGGRPALEQLQQIFMQLPNHEQQLAQRGLHLGQTVSEYKDHFEAGDFLVRNVVGIDHATGAIAVGDYVRVGTTVQFHIRDEKSAHDDLELQLQRRRPARPPKACLLFTCNGRGTRLFSQPNHDAQMITQQLGPIPLAGFFAQGELGPVQQTNFLHGFTASLALFE